MKEVQEADIIQLFQKQIAAKNFPCIAAKAALGKNQLHYMVASHMACPHDDDNILQFIYNFIDTYRANASLYQSAVVIFRQPVMIDENMFELFFWKRLQSITDRDARNYKYDARVSKDPTNSTFSFSLKEESFFLIGMHPASSRPARRFAYPAIIFNPHAQFEALRAAHRYENMKRTVRQRDLLYNGSVNPMLSDFGEQPEVFQYTGKKYDASWQCPLKINHEKYGNNSAT